jgi:hypothetical protein
MMKVIFLDIDGVLNCDKTRNPRKFPYVVDKKLLGRLSNLLDRTNAKVVLSSSWRLDPVGILAAKHWRIPFERPSRRSEVRYWPMRALTLGQERQSLTGSGHRFIGVQLRQRELLPGTSPPRSSTYCFPPTTPEQMTASDPMQNPFRTRLDLHSKY